MDRTYITCPVECDVDIDFDDILACMDISDIKELLRLKQAKADTVPLGSNYEFRRMICDLLGLGKASTDNEIIETLLTKI